LRNVSIGDSLAAKRQLSRKTSTTLQCYIMLALPIIGFFVFTLYPILWSFRWSLFAYNGVAHEARFVGLDNFISVFTKDAAYWTSWKNTILFAVLKLALEIPLAMILALILNQRFKLTGFYRSVYYLPSVVSVAIIGLVFSNMFNYFGIINALLQNLGLIAEPIDWLADREKAIMVIVIASAWNTFGVNTMYILAALTGVPREVYEAARLDGASPTRTFFSITLPLIIPVFQTVLLLAMLGSLSINDFILTLTGGGPSGSTHSVMSHMTRQFVPGFTENARPAIGYGCAMSLTTTVILSFITVGYKRLANYLKEKY